MPSNKVKKQKPSPQDIISLIEQGLLKDVKHMLENRPEMPKQRVICLTPYLAYEERIAEMTGLEESQVQQLERLYHQRNKEVG